MRQPNIVLFITHDTGRHLAPYGIDAVHTPHADRLAAEGVRLQNAFCTSPLCSPSRAACVTGRYPHQNGVMGLTGDPTGGFELYPGERHAARLFADAGYESVLCGTAHETRDPAGSGFGRLLRGGDLLDYGAVLGEWLQGRDAAQPFYLQIGCHETHRVWTKNAVPYAERGVWMPPYLADHPDLRAEMGEFQGAVNRLDQGLGGILDALESNGVAADTLLVFTTDHGIDVPRAKGTCFDPGLEVFCILRYPNGGWPTGAAPTPAISQIDLLPTLLDACGLPAPADLAGRSFLPLLRGEAYRPADALFAEKTFHDTYDPQRAVRTDRYKYIRYFEVNIFEDLRLATMERRPYWKTPWRRQGNIVDALYDLAADPRETNNLADDPAYAAIKEDLKKRLAQWMGQTADPLLDGPVPSPNYQTALEDLRQYLD